MDDNLNDLETGMISNIPKNLNKKMRKRKHLDALLKFRSTKTNSTDILRSSEDELFLPHQKSSNTKLRSSFYRRCWKYSKHILSFTLICIFVIVCVGLTYANIQLKNEVQNLSSRINEMEKKFTNIESNNISSIIEQIKTRLQFSEYSKFLLKNKSTEKNENPSTKIQELKTSLEQLSSLVHNSSDKTSVILTGFQSDLNKLRSKIDQCKCSNESIVSNDKLQQSKPNSNENQQIANNIDVEQIVNEPSVPN